MRLFAIAVFIVSCIAASIANFQSTESHESAHPADVGINDGKNPTLHQSALLQPDEKRIKREVSKEGLAQLKQTLPVSDSLEAFEEIYPRILALTVVLLALIIGTFEFSS